MCHFKATRVQKAVPVPRINYLNLLSCAICQSFCFGPSLLLGAGFGHLATIFTHPKGSFGRLDKECDGWKSCGGVLDLKTLHFLLLLLRRSRTYARGVLLCPSNVREVRLIPLPPDGEGCALPRTEFYSNCCPVRQRHSHRSPGDCYPPTTTSRSIITTSSTILISSTSPQRRFGRFSLLFLGSTFRRFSAALRGSTR